MSKIFSVNFNKSLNDKYGATATLGATAKLGKDEKGLALKCQSVATDYITYGDLASINNIGTGEFSVICGANIKGFLNHGSSGNALIGKGNGSATGFALIYGVNTAIYFTILNSSITATINHQNKNNLYILTRNSAGLCSMYVNGIAYGTPVTQSSNIATSGSLLTIGCDASTQRTPNASIYLSEVYNHCLSDVEIQKLTADFQAQFPISKPKRGFIQAKATDLSSLSNTGLIAAYSMVKQGNTLVDISGNNNNATVSSGLVQTKDGIIFPAKDTMVIATTTTPLKEAECTVNLRLTPRDISTANQRVFRSVGANSNRFYLYVNGTTLTITRGNNTATNITNVFITANIDYNITWYWNHTGYISKVYVNGISVYDGTYDGISNGGDGILQLNGNAAEVPFNGIVKDVKIYNRVLSLAEITAYHNSFVQPYIAECFCDLVCDGSSITPTGWIAGTGTFAGEEIVTADTVLKTITKGTKVLKCLTAGTIAIPSQQAYGTWEFDWYKGNDTTSPFVQFIAPGSAFVSSTSIGGYDFRIASTESIILVKTAAASVITSAASYIIFNTWYRIKITRSNVGVFTLLIKGGAFTPTAGYDGYTLVSVSGGAGTNPATDNSYTTSNYFVLDLDAGDRIGNLVVKNGIII